MPDILSAFVVGATGQVGKAIVHELAKTPDFSRVTLFTRRKIDLPSNSDGQNDYRKFEQKIVNFDRLAQDHSNEFEGFDVGFCCIGLGIRGKSQEEVQKVDYDYTLEVAKLAKAGGCKHFNLLSGKYASKDSRFFGIRVKGLVEEAIIQLKYDRFTSVRPGQLVGGAKDSATAGEKIFSSIMQYTDCTRAFSCEVPVLARVLVHNALNVSSGAVEIFENGDIHKIGKELRKQKSTE